LEKYNGSVRLLRRGVDDSDRTEHLHIFSVEIVMESLLVKLCEFGSTGIFAALLAYDVFFLQKKLITTIENNTKAMTDLKNYCSNKKESLQ
jgi:hypothetical protein